MKQFDFCVHTPFKNVFLDPTCLDSLKNKPKQTLFWLNLTVWLANTLFRPICQLLEYVVVLLRLQILYCM